MPIDESKRKTWHCPHCEKVFKTPQAMKEHVVVKHEGTATQKCDECQRSFGTYSKLRDHKKLVHERLSILNKFQNYVFALQFLHFSLK